MTNPTTPTPSPVDSAEVRRRLAAHGHTLPTPWQVPSVPGGAIPARLVRRVGDRLYVSGHVPTDTDGTVTGPYGKVGDTVTLADAQQAAVRTILSVIASVEATLGDLAAVDAWCSLHCMTNSAPGFTDFPTVFNPASQVLIDAFGEERGTHARVAVGVSGLPWDLPVEIQAELRVRD